MTDPDDTLDQRGHSLRNFSPEEFAVVYTNARTEDDRHAVRTSLKRIDAGRWYDLLDEAHNHLAHCDLASQDHIQSLYSDEFLRWIGVFGLVEDLNTFQKLTGISR